MEAFQSLVSMVKTRTEEQTRRLAHETEVDDPYNGQQASFPVRVARSKFIYRSKFIIYRSKLFIALKIALKIIYRSKFIAMALKTVCMLKIFCQKKSAF